MASIAGTKAEDAKISWTSYFSGGAIGPFIGLIALCTFLAFTSDTFLTLRNFLNVMDQITVIGVMAIGMTLVILLGGIDLSVGSVLALSGMVLGYLGNYLGWPFGLGIVAALVVSALCGVVSGLMITKLNMPAFIATLAMMSIARGIASIITDGQQIVGFPDWFSSLAIIRHFGLLSATVAAMVVLTIVFFVFLKYRPAGRALYAIGGNPEVARLAGIHVERATLLVYTVCALLAGLAGVILSARLDSAQPSSGIGYELDTIAAVVIGGASLSGGVGGIGGTVVGVLIIGFLRNGLNLLHVSPFVQQVIIGVVIALAVAADTLRARHR
ncbi:ABC transporter permease [Consotaella salsifontis]|uniref:Monosaccharide ABC transporter membrane protein, CUT2 family n=1 Tax=Consotaella salsifontis TaxID=1365950 RepID=A0A1T4RP28_9HYPH|nr:ABC transporter permease [Consotaella salsifontis]SKA17729.1 monosaccharide ABC transporter membrane protein, CUT2 family [Consotaella salsifontis]